MVFIHGHQIKKKKIEDSQFMRTVIPYEIYGHVPNKHVYVVDFSSRFSDNNNINGYLNTQNNVNIQFVFEGLVNNSQLTVFSKEIDLFSMKLDTFSSQPTNNWNAGILPKKNSAN